MLFSAIVFQTHYTLFTPKILYNRCFQFLLGITVVPREIQDIMKNLGRGGKGLNKVHYGLCENGEYNCHR